MVLFFCIHSVFNLSCFAEASEHIGLEVNQDKIKVLHQPTLQTRQYFYLYDKAEISWSVLLQKLLHSKTKKRHDEKKKKQGKIRHVVKENATHFVAMSQLRPTLVSN